MKTSNMTIFSLVLLVLSTDMAMAARETDGRTLAAAATDCETTLFPAVCIDIKPCVQICNANNPLNWQVTKIFCVDTGCRCTFCPKAAIN
uniref:Uncharacterized protein n=1 Tax=Leersia perrieri TaxID=77586 RepID=A0A0D9XT15_9ORYZ